MASQRPNILFIMADQHNASCVGYEGHPDVRTPNLDNLASDGVTFRRAYSCKSECMPSRVTFLTGLYSHTHGITGNTNDEIPDFPSVVEQLRSEGGYRTGAVGKWHIGDWEHHGFEELELAAGNKWMNKYKDYVKSKGLTSNSLDVVNCHTGCSGMAYEDTLTSWTSRETMHMIDKFSEEDQPFFIWSSFSPPHNPYAVPEDNPFPYDPQEIQLPSYDIRRYRMKPLAWRRGVENVWSADVAGEAKLREAVANYYSQISMIDDQVGQMVQHLESKGLLENTIIIYTADHGDFAGEHGQMGKNTPGPYEPLYRIPMLWYWKGCFGRDVVHNMAENVDFYPTICELAGLDVPMHCQGDSLAGRLVGSGTNGGYRQPRKDKVFFDEAFVRAVRTLDRKLAFAFDGAEMKGEMYDLEQDPNELHNVFNDPQYREDRLRLMEELTAWMIRTDQPYFWTDTDYPMPPIRWYQQNPRFPRGSEKAGTVWPDT